MEKDTTTQTIAQKTLKLFLGCLILFLIIFALYWCNSKPHPFIKPNSNDSINNAIADKQAVIDMTIENNKALRLKIDSLSNLKPKVIVRYKTVYDSLYIEDSLCRKSLIVLHHEHAIIDSVNNQIITNQENHLINDSHIIGNLTEVVSLQKLQHKRDSTRNKQLTDTIPTVKRKGYIKGFIHGFGSGAAVTKGVEVITNLK